MLGPEFEARGRFGRGGGQTPEGEVCLQRPVVLRPFAADPDPARLGQFPRLAPAKAWE